MKLIIAGDFIPNSSKEINISKELKSLINSVDYSIVNLEAPLTNSNNKILKPGNSFKRSPKSINQVLDAGFSVVTLANNHILDFTHEGLRETLKTCNEHAIKTVGAGLEMESAFKPLCLEKNNIKVAVINVCDNEFTKCPQNKGFVNNLNLLRLFNEIIELKSKCFQVLIIYHGGIEYMHYPTPELKQLFELLISFGADALLCHHSHYLSGITEYKGKPIFYGLGNFYKSSAKVDSNLNIGIVAEIHFEKDRITEYKSHFIKFDSISISMLHGDELKMIYSKVQEINKIITCSNQLDDVWTNYYQRELNRTVSIMLSNSRYRFKLAKKSKLFRTKLTKFKLLVMLNLFRSDTHRQKTINILELMYNKLSKKHGQ